MGLANFAQLVTAVQDTLNRQDLNARVPDWIKLAEANFNRKVFWRKTLVRDVIVAPSADEDYENLPSDFRALKMVRFNTSIPVYPEPVTPDMIGHKRAIARGAGGTPRFYAILGTQILFDRLPTGSPELELLSYVKIPALNDSTQTSNGLLEEHPDIYLYGTLLHSAPFLKHDERIETWTALYMAAIQELEAADKKAESSPSPLRMRAKRSF